MPFKPGPRKAEKDAEGNATYICLWIGCDKTFRTAGHVRRHERSHAGTKPYDCAYCDKSFGRSDVRAKHIATMHGGELEIKSSESGTPPHKMRRLEDPRRSPSVSLHTPHSNASSSEMQQQQQQQQQHFHQQTQVPMTVPWQQPQPSQQPRLDRRMSFTAANPPMYTTASASAPPNILNTMLPPASTAFDLRGQSPKNYLQNPSPTGFLDPSSLSTGSSTLQMDQGPMLSATPGGTNDLFNPFSANWDLFGQVFGWGLDNDIDLDLGITNNLFESGNIGPVSSTENLSAAWLLAATPRHGSPVDGDTEERRDPFGRSHDNPWPSVFRPKVPDRPLTLGGVKASPRANRDRTGTLAVSQTSRNAMLSLFYLSHQALWQMPDIDEFPDHDTLSDFVDLYFEKFHPTFPILHKATFYATDTPAVLLLAVAAIGATYADREFRPLAVALDELVRRIITWARASDQRAKFDRQNLQAYLLYAVLAVACGSREMFLHAEISRGSLVTARRRTNMLRAGPTNSEEPLYKDPKANLEERYKAYVEDEGKRRLGWGIYVLDMHMCALLGLPAMSSFGEITAGFPDDESIWEAPDAQAWAKAYAAAGQKPTVTLAKTVKTALSKPELLPTVNDFTSSLLAFTLYRFAFDEYQLNRSLGLDDPDDDINRDGAATKAAHSKPSKAQAALLALSKTCLSLTIPSHLRLSASALYHHAALQFTRPGLLENVRSASGKFEPDLTKESSIEWLRDWVKNSQEVRKVMWHAAVLNALLGEFSKGEFAEFYWTFDCALVLWAIVKYGLDSLKGAGLRSALFAANWFDADPPSVWIEHGGQIVMPFLGSSTSMTVVDTLKLFMDRLDMSPWGLAGQFRQVLAKLLEAEKAGAVGP